MSAADIVAEFRKLPFAEKEAVLAELLHETDDALTPEEIAELDRRAEFALAHPERCRPLEDVAADIEKRLRKQP